MTALTYFQIFASMFTAALLFMFRGLLTYKQLVTVVAVIGAVWLLWQFYLNSGKIPRLLFTYFALAGMVIIFYYITSLRYGRSNTGHTSYFLVLIAQITPAVLCSVYVAKSKTGQAKIKQMAPVVALLFSFIAYQAVLHPTGKTSGGALLTDYGLNYQSAAYLISYAAGLAEYYIVSFEDIVWPTVFRRRLVRLAMMLLVLVDFFLILLAGGRGGVVLFAFETLLSIFLWQKKTGRNLTGVLWILFATLLIIILAYYIIYSAANATVATSGFGRIVQTLRTGESSGRDRLYPYAFRRFLDSPIIGHGFGSVYYEVGFYSHNLFLDILVETGVVGLFVWIVILVRAVKIYISHIMVDYSEYLWLLFFLFGFIQGQFSGYYLAHIEMFWSLAFIFAITRNQEIRVKARTGV